MVIIRLARHGAKKRPFYRIVAADSRFSRDGRHLEQLGYFNPIAKGGEHRLFMLLERVEYWIANGAKPSERVATLIKEARLMPSMEVQKPLRKKRIVHRAAVKEVTSVMPAGPKKGKKGTGPAKKAAGEGKAAKPAAKKPTTPKKPRPKTAAAATPATKTEE